MAKDNEFWGVIGEIATPIDPPLKVNEDFFVLLDSTKPTDPFGIWRDRFRESRNAKRRSMVITFQLNVWNRLFPWMNTPILHYITSFWIGLIDEGPRELLTPRWGGITFGWLNDGIRPTVWHTLRTLTHSQTDPYTGIYPRGAPSSLKQAQEWEKEWKRVS